MDVPPDPLVIFADRIDGGLVIGFDDGKAAYYSAALLHGTLDQAQILSSDSEDNMPLIECGA